MGNKIDNPSHSPTTVHESINKYSTMELSEGSASTAEQEHSLYIDHVKIKELRDVLSNSNNNTEQPSATQNIFTIHLVFFVHGLCGSPHELQYLQTTLEKLARNKHATNNDSLKSSILMTHSIEANYGQTWDGIAAGGRRLAQEVNGVIRNVVDASEENMRPLIITVSIVGHSLGGLYSRYALQHIDFLQSDQTGRKDNDSNKNFSETVKIVPKIFCTTATPHLGVSQHTYLPIPRALEWAAAQVMQQTGRDLFRISSSSSSPSSSTIPDIIQLMATHQNFTKPLRAFQRRIAYVNAFSTDFQVPTSTGAFLSKTDSIHYYRCRQNMVLANDNTTLKVDADDDVCEAKQSEVKALHVDQTIEDPIETENSSKAIDSDSVVNSFPAAANVETENSEQEQLEVIGKQFTDYSTFEVETPQCSVESVAYEGDVAFLEGDVLARQLDSMGWIKVFCDVRPHLWTVVRPFASPTLLSKSQNASMASLLLSNNHNDSWTSDQLLQSLARSDDKDIWHAPMAHTILVANSKTEQFAKFSAAGKPFMDELAQKLVQEILISSDGL